MTGAGPGWADPRVLLQDLREFTVKIRHPETHDVMGTGILVSLEGIVVTCAHVLHNHGLDPGALGTAVEIYFPARRSRDAQASTGRVLWCTREGFADDVVCLQVEASVPSDLESVAVLGTAAFSRNHQFQSYGFKRLQKYGGSIADGLILGDVDPPDDVRLMADPVQLRSSQINAGMSGAAVLDIDRNLVVGIVAEAWFSDSWAKDRDTAWAVDAKVLHLTGLGLPVRTERLPLQSAELPHYDRTLVRRAVPAPGNRLDDAPLPLDDWIGREPVLAQLDHASGEDRTLVIGLVGLGGEGKTSIARRWIDRYLSRSEGGAGVMWWSFTDRASADEFLDNAIEFMSGGRIDPAKLADLGGQRPALLAGMMAKNSYLMVLDGLEVMQHQRGDRYGSFVSDELRDFLEYAATPGHQSLLLLTSRVPALDLAPYRTYRQVTVEPLTTAEGLDLLRTLGVVGSDAALEQVVHDWDGHALTLSLIATYLQRRYQGDVRRVSSLPPPRPDEPRDQQVRRILAEYDTCLNPAERVLLDRLSIFRTPADAAAIQSIVADTPEVPSWSVLRSTTLRYLLASRIVRRDQVGRFSMHPLVRDFYAVRAETDEPARQGLHTLAKEYYLGLIDESNPRPVLDDLVPAIEAAHHASRAGAHTESCDIIYEKLYRGERGVIARELNAYETALSVFVELFPAQDIWQDPLPEDPGDRCWILHEVATCLQLLGRLRDAAVMFRRATAAFRALREWNDAAVTCQNLTELYLSLGALPACHSLVMEAFEFARLADDKEHLLVAETLRGALAHLEGHARQAQEAFLNALALATDFTPLPALYSSSGVRYAQHLLTQGRMDAAREVSTRNLEICQAAGWRADTGLCQVELGNLAMAEGDLGEARHRFDEAYAIARGITRRDVLIAALHGRGRLELREGNTAEAAMLLGQARNLSVLGGYRLAEVEVRVELALLAIELGERDQAQDELNQAEQISMEIGFHWGMAGARKARDRLRHS